MKNSTTNPEQVRQRVSRTYGAIVSEQRGSCCGNNKEQRGVAAKTAGYARNELGALPDDAVVNSFGCGNPVAFSEVSAGEVVLDLGCGAGIDLLLAAHKVGPTGRVIGIDMTDEMIDRARRNIADAGLNNVEVRKGIIEELPVEDRSVDWVISNCVINLSPDKTRVFAEIARVLKPGGRLRVSDIVASHIPDWLRKSEKLYDSCIAGAISEDEYLEGLRTAGLTDVKVLDRLLYDTAQIKGFMESEVTPERSGCCSELFQDRSIDEVATAAQGKVWSALIAAKKNQDLESGT